MSYPNYYNQQIGGYLNQPMQPQMSIPQFQPQQNNFLGGKIVDSVDVVRVTDIPIDGNNYYFPKADGSEIYVKRWLGNGTTDIAVFKKQEAVVEEPKQEIDFVAMQDNIISKLDSIDERITKIEKSLGSSKPTARKE